MICQICGRDSTYIIIKMLPIGVEFVCRECEYELSYCEKFSWKAEADQLKLFQP